MFLRIFALIVLLALPGAAWTYGPDDSQPPPVRTWTVRNQCREAVRVALNYQKVEGRIVTRGWWQLQPQTEVRIQMLSERIGYFAVSLSKTMWWNDPAGPRFGLDLDRDFEYPGDGTERGRWIYSFHWRSVIERPIETLTCP